MGISKCDSSSHPRTNCGIAQYSAKGSKIFTWFEMKKQVLCGSNPGARITFTFAPAKKIMRRQNVRCSQSCFLGSNAIASAINIGTAIAKCNRLTTHSSALRRTYQARLICKCPKRMEQYPALCIPEKKFPHRSEHPREPEF